jgi:TIR domain
MNIQGESFDVFLSYSRSDAAAAGQLVQALRARGLKVFFDRDYLTPGQQWPELLEASLRGCRSAAICLGPQGLGPWQKREQYVALDRQVQDSSFSVVPVLLPGAKDPPLGFLRLETWVDLKGGVDSEAGLTLLQQAIRGQAPLPADVGLPDPRAALCPFRGLEPFREEDEAFFVGREAFTRVLIDKVGQRPLIGVIGASGSGKSSVVLAGLVPALRRGADGRVWEIGLMRPGQYPLRQLAAAFLPPDPGLDEFARIALLKERAQQLASGKVTLADVVETTLNNESGTDRLLLVIDQWEELYTHANDAEGGQEREDFLRVLLTGLDGKRLSIVLTLRGDFYGRALQDRLLADRLQDAVVNVSPMLRDELRRVIEEPAAKVGLSFEAGLIDEILSDVGNEPGNLPLLEFLLKELWDRRTGDGRLTFAAYGETGGVRRAIAERAEAEFAKLSVEQKAAARRFMIRLVTPGEGQEDTRARVAIPQGNDAVRAVIERFAQARLLTTRFDPASGREVVEVGHEALIREWDTLKGWVDADREFLRTVQRVKLAMQVWQEETGDKTQRLLPPGRPLEEARELLARDRAEVDDIRPFIEASIARDEAQQEKEQQAREEQQQKELAAANERAEAARQLAEERARGEAAAKRLADEVVARARMTRRMAIAGTAIAFAVLIGFAGLLIQSVDRLQQARAESIWSRLELDAQLRPFEIDELWLLATARPSAFEAAWWRLARVPSLFEAFWQQVSGENDRVVHVGHIVKLGKGPGLLARTAGLNEGPRSKAVAGAVLNAFHMTRDLDLRAALAKTLGALPIELTAQQSTSLFAAVIQPPRHEGDRSADESDRPADESDRADIGDVVVGLAPVLTSNQAAVGMNTLLQALHGGIEPDQRIAVMKALVPLAAKQKAPAVAAIDLVLKELSSADPVNRVALADVLARLMVAPGSEKSPAVIDAVVAAFQAETDQNRRSALAGSLRILASKASPEQASVLASHIGPHVARHLGIHPADGADPGFQRSFEELLTLLTRVTAGTWQEPDLTAAIPTIPRPLDTNRGSALFSQEFAGLALLTPVQAASAFTRAVELLLATPGMTVQSVEMWSIPAVVIYRVAHLVDPDLAADAAKRLVQSFPDPGASPGVSPASVAFAFALAPLLSALQPQQAAAGSDLILRTLKLASDSNVRMELAAVIARFPLRSSEAVKATIDAMLPALDGPDLAERARRVEEVGALAPMLTSEQATTVKESILRVLSTTTNRTQRKRLIAALARLPAQLTPEQIVTISGIIRGEIASAGKIDDGEQWASAIDGLLRSRPEVEHVAEVIELLKYPTMAGKPGDTLLASLRERFRDFPAQGANLRDFAAWVRARFPKLAAKLSEPPVRPGS